MSLKFKIKKLKKNVVVPVIYRKVTKDGFKFRQWILYQLYAEGIKFT